MPGVIVGFEPFKNLPSIVVAYLDSNYSTAGLTFKSYNSKTEDFEIVADVNDNTLEVDKADLVSKFNSEILKKEMERDEIIRKKQYFLDNFGAYFEDTQSEDTFS